jgi:nickel-dependent lactate racemase
MIEFGSPDTTIEKSKKCELLNQYLQERVHGQVKRLLLIPPDHTRLYSDAGWITAYLYEELKETVHIDIMPALGTHVPMNDEEIDMMFGPEIPKSCFMPHHWRDDLSELGEVSQEFIETVSNGKVSYPMQVAVNKQLIEGDYDLILSIGQVVPHEVIGMANYTKNILIGVGGGDTIHKSHFLGAAYGMESMMGHIDTPVRRVLNHGFENFLHQLPIEFIFTVMQKTESDVVMRGMYFGGEEAFVKAAKLSQKVNLDLLDKPIKKAVAYLDPREFKTTWLGNKAVYRLRMAMADEGELIILAPDLHGFGEDEKIDELIRKYGYKGTNEILKQVGAQAELKDNLSAAAHLIHGSSDGRFKITYCPGPGMSQDEIESVGYDYAPLDEMMEKYPIKKLSDGWNTVGGEEVFYVSNPALGLWALKENFEA